MVAIGRALMARPRLLLLDEPSLGLAPAVVDHMFDDHPRDPRRGRGDPPRRAERGPGAGDRRPRLRAGGGPGRGRRPAGRACASDRASGRRILVCATSPTSTREGGTAMAVIKVRDLAYGRLQAPDLDVMEEFLTHFGHDPVGADAHRALHARHRSAPPPARDREGRPRLRRLRLRRRQRGRSHAGGEGAGRLARWSRSTSPAAASACACGSRTATRSRSCTASRTLPAIPVERQHMNTGTEPLRRAGELMRLRSRRRRSSASATACSARPRCGRPCSGSATRSGSSAPTTSTRATRTTSSARSTAATAATSSSTTTRCSAVMNERAGMNHMSFEVPDVDAVFKDHEYLDAPGQVRAHVGRRPAPARQPGLRLLGRSRGAACTSAGPTPTA